MKKMRKLVSALLMAAMVMTSVTSVADGETAESGNTTTTANTVTALSGAPSSSDTVAVKITDITGGPTVTLYQLASARYGDEGKEFIEYTWATDVTLTSNGPTAEEISAIANRIYDTINPLNLKKINNGTLTDGTYTCTVNAGAYLAVLTGATDGSVYNPILLTASYEGTDIIGGTVSAESNYLYGSTSVAKKSSPSIDKSVEGTETDTSDGSTAGRATASVGDVLTYTLTPTMPSYPVGAANKTFFISDTMEAGLTLDYSSLNITIAGQTVTKDGNEFKLGDKVIANAVQTSESGTVTGFNICFNYDNLIYGDGGAVYQPIVKYEAVINESATVGSDGNDNTATLYYANQPNNGSTYEEVNTKPDDATGVEKDTDTETVYTYQLAFKKTGEDSEEETEAGTGNAVAEPLENAVFGIYSDSACTDAYLVDIVKTNANGYAVSTNVAAGDYWIKEIAAPDGYSLNESSFKVTASWTSATRTVTGTITDRIYTTEKSDDAVQVGWIKDSVFYEMSKYSSEDAATEADAEAAYLTKENVTETTATTITAASTECGGTTYLSTAIPNTKLSALPSTGGIGTYLFTIVGVAVMAAMALMFLRGRKEEE